MTATHAASGTLYITSSETRSELQAAAASHGWSLDGIDIYEIVPPELSLDPAHEQSVIYTADLELGETVRMVMAELERVRPTRVVFDSLADIRLLAQSGLRYRRQVMALKYYLSRNGTTALLLDDLTEYQDNLALHSVAAWGDPAGTGRPAIRRRAAAIARLQDAGANSAAATTTS